MSLLAKTLSNTDKNFIVDELTKRGIKKIILTPTHNVTFDGVILEGNKLHEIEFPEINGCLPSRITLSSSEATWYCGVRVSELGGKGFPNYFSIKKENNSGIPTT